MDKKDLKKPLLDKKGDKNDDKKEVEQKWGDSSLKKSYNIWYFLGFTFPKLWEGGWLIRIQTVLAFTFMILSKVVNVAHPVVLKYAVDSV